MPIVFRIVFRGDVRLLRRRPQALAGRIPLRSARQEGEKTLPQDIVDTASDMPAQCKAKAVRNESAMRKCTQRGRRK